MYKYELNLYDDIVNIEVENPISKGESVIYEGDCLIVVNVLHSDNTTLYLS